MDQETQERLSTLTNQAMGWAFEGAGFDVPVIERYAKMLLHVYRQDPSA